MSIWLVMQATDGRERSFAVQKPTMVIGRETTCDVRVPIPSVSQKHCQITLDGDELRMTDLRSDHGTFHNGNRVQEAVLAHEDTLTVGPVTFKIRVLHDVEAAAGQAPEIVIERQDNVTQSADSDRSPAPINDVENLSAG